MRIFKIVAVMLFLVIVLPIPLLIAINIWVGTLEGFELHIYGVLLVIFAAGAISTGLYPAWRPRHRNVVTYAFAGAVGSAALTTAFDRIDDYASLPGIGWVWPLFGLVLGSVFGGVFRATYGRLQGR